MERSRERVSHRPVAEFSRQLVQPMKNGKKIPAKLAADMFFNPMR